MKKFNISLESSAQEYRLGQAIIVTICIENITDDTYAILKWNTPLEGLVSNCLSLTYQNQDIEYDGICVKRGEPREKDYLMLMPRSKHYEEFELTAAYKIDKVGEYKLELRTSSLILQPFSHTEKFILNPIEKLPVESIFADQIIFNITEGKEARLTRGEEERKKFLDKKISFTLEDFPEPKITGGDGSPVQDLFQKKLLEAHYALIDYLSMSLKALEHDKLNSKSYYQMVFGAYTDIRYGTVKTVFQKVYEWLKTKEITYVLNSLVCEPTWYAYTYYGCTNIYICAVGQDIPFSGTDSLIGTLFHEFTHAAARTADVPDSYGRPQCRLLAKNDPGKAITNADSYEFFLETLYMYWEKHTIITHPVITNNTPDAVVYNEKLYVFYIKKATKHLCYVCLDKGTWLEEKNTNLESEQSPRAVVYGGKLYIFYKKSGLNELWYAYLDTPGWVSAAINVGNVSIMSDQTPNVAVYKDTLYIGYRKGTSTVPNDHNLCCACYNGSEWVSKNIHPQIPQSSHNPGMAVYRDVLYFAYRSAFPGTTNNVLYFITFNNTTWTGNMPIMLSDKFLVSTYGPRLAAVDDTLYLLYDGVQTNIMYQSQLQHNSKKDSNFWAGNESSEFNSDILPFPKAIGEHIVISYNGFNYKIFSDMSGILCYIKQNTLAIP